MKNLLYIILLLPLWVNAQTNGTIQKTSSTGTIRGSFGSLGLDTLPRVTGALIDGYILKYHAATNKWYASPDPTYPGVQDSLTKKANRTFDNVASGSIASSKLTSPNGILSGQGGVLTGNSLMTFSNDSTITYRGLKFLHTGLTSQNPGGADYSTFLGYRAGEEFLNGSQGYANTGIGRGALLNLKSNVASEASSNTALGHNAGRFLTTTTGATLIGTGSGDALTTNATSEGVVGMGWHAFNQSTSAYRSTAIGTSSLYQLNSVLPSAIVGYRGAFSSTTADYLAGVGANVFENNVTGDRKSALGGLAAQNSKGSRTVHIGTQSDSGTGDDIIMIGDFTRPSTWNASNEGNIGNVLLFKGVTVDSAQNSSAQLGIGVNRASGIAGRRIESFIGNGSIPTVDSIGVRRQTNFLANNDGYINNTSQIGFGYTTPSNTYVPAAIGMVTTNQGGNTYGDVFIATRNVNTDTKPTVGLWVRSGGGVQLPNLTGSVTDMMTIDNAGNVGRTTIPSGGGGGTVVSVGVNSSNGFAGSSSGGANPALTLSTTVTGILKGNGTAISAASAGDFPTLNQNTTGTADYANLAYTWDTYNGVYSSGTIGYGLVFNNTTSKIESASAADVKSFLSLGNVSNTSDANKPVSTAQQTALDLKANLASPTFTGTVSGITASMVGAPSGSGTSTGTNTGDQNLAPYAPLASPALTGNPTAPTQSAGDNSTKIATTAYVDGALLSRANRILKDWYTDESNVTTTETDLYAYTVPANTLVNNGDKIDFNISGTYGNTGNTKTVELYFGSSSFHLWNVTSSGGAWIVRGTIIKVDATTYRLDIISQSTTVNVPKSTSGTVANYTGTNVFKITGKGTTTADITAKMGYLEFKPAAL